MFDKLFCLFGFHSWSEWMPGYDIDNSDNSIYNEPNYYTRFCIKCNHNHKYYLNLF